MDIRNLSMAKKIQLISGLVSAIGGGIALFWALMTMDTYSYYSWKQPFTKFEAQVVTTKWLGILFLVSGIVELIFFFVTLKASNTRTQPVEDRHYEKRPAQKFCIRCGTVMDFEDRFCPNCGADTAEAEREEGREVKRLTSERRVCTPPVRKRNDLWENNFENEETVLLDHPPYPYDSSSTYAREAEKPIGVDHSIPEDNYSGEAAKNNSNGFTSAGDL